MKPEGQFPVVVLLAPSDPRATRLPVLTLGAGRVDGATRAEPGATASGLGAGCCLLIRVG